MAKILTVLMAKIFNRLKMAKIFNRLNVILSGLPCNRDLPENNG